MPKRSLMLLMDRDRTKLKTRRLDQAVRQLQKHSAVRVLAPDDSHVLLARKFTILVWRTAMVSSNTCRLPTLFRGGNMARGRIA